MCVTTLAALLGLAAGCVAAAPSPLLAPADPRVETRWRPQPPPTRGLKRYEPVTAQADWGTAPTPPPAATPGMKGMDMKGMGGMDMRGMDMGNHK